MYLIWWISGTLYSPACQLIVIVGDWCLRCCATVARDICGFSTMNSLDVLSHNRRFPEITGEDNLTVFLLRESEVP